MGSERGKIQEKGLKNSEVYKKALVDKKIFSKIKNNLVTHCIGFLQK